MTVERYLFLLPEDPEACVAAVAVIQGYCQEVRDRKIEPELYVQWPNLDCLFLIDALPQPCYGWRETSPTLEFDLVFQFDLERAHRLAVATQKHMVQAFGIQIGVDPRVLPDLSVLNPEGPECDILVLEWPEARVLLSYLETNWSSLSNVRWVGEGRDPLESWRFAQQARLVVGPQSVTTYLAAALGRAVVEIVPPSRGHRRWLSKWTNPNYQMVYVELEQARAALVYRAVEALCRRTFSVPA